MKLTKWFARLYFLFFSIQHLSCDNYYAIEHYNSGDSSEQVSFIKINTVTSWNTAEVVYSLQIPGLKTGDIIFATAEMEVTNDCGYNAVITSEITLTDTPSKLPNQSPKYAITEANGFNVTPPMHHGVVHKSGTFVCPSNLGDMYVNLCCLSASTAANPNLSDMLKVEQDYGRLSVIVYKKQ